MLSCDRLKASAITLDGTQHGSLGMYFRSGSSFCSRMTAAWCSLSQCMGTATTGGGPFMSSSTTGTGSNPQSEPLDTYAPPPPAAPPAPPAAPPAPPAAPLATYADAPPPPPATPGGDTTACPRCGCAKAAAMASSSPGHAAPLCPRGELSGEMREITTGCCAGGWDAGGWRRGGCGGGCDPCGW